MFCRIILGDWNRKIIVFFIECCQGLAEAFFTKSIWYGVKGENADPDFYSAFWKSVIRKNNQMVYIIIKRLSLITAKGVL